MSRAAAVVVLSIALASACTPGGPAASHESAPSTAAFVNVNVVPMDAEHVLREQTVVVRAGRIHALGPASAVAVPADALRVEGRGRYLMPGLADMHVHVWHETDLPLYLANGITTIRNMNGRPYHLQWRAQVESGPRTGPRILTSGPTVYRDPDDAAQLVQEQKRAGYDFIKVYHYLSAEAHRQILRAAEREGIAVVGHKAAKLPLAELMKSHQNSIEHVQGYIFLIEADGSPLRAALLRGQWSHRYHYLGVSVDPKKLPPIAAATQQAGFWNCPTIVSGDRWAPRTELEGILSQPHMRWVTPPMASRPTMEEYLADSTPEIRALGRANRRLLVRELHRAGAKLLLGTDAGAASTEPGFSIHNELQNLIESGLTRYEALRAGTWNPAEFLGLLREAGSVAAGKRADLVLLEGNPLADLQTLRKPVGVMLAGRWFSTVELQEILERQLTHAPRD